MVDPRDQVSEVDDPAYRVYFWPSPTACEEWELREADLDEVLEWVAADGAGRPHSLWVSIPDVSDVRSGVRLIRLRGVDPPAPPETWPDWATEAC